MDAETEELYRAYKYCKLFHCSVTEYEERPHWESSWLLKIDDTYHEVKRELEEAAEQRQG